jgi:hypothetical protein
MAAAIPAGVPAAAAEAAAEAAAAAIQIPPIPLLIVPNPQQLTPNFTPNNVNVGNNIESFNEMFHYIFNYIYPNTNEQTKERLINEFKQLNDKTRFKLLENIIDVDGNFTQEFSDLILANYNIADWGRRNGYNENPLWKNLVEKLAVTQIHSLTKMNIDISELFRLIGNKLNTLNKMVEIDRKIYRNKYLKYKQKYLKLKNGD